MEYMWWKIVLGAGALLGILGGAPNGPFFLLLVVLVDSKLWFHSRMVFMFKDVSGWIVKWY